MKFLTSWLSNVIAIFVASLLISSITYDHNFLILVLTGLVFGLVNMFVRPLVIILTLPAVVLSLGFALVLINALMLALTAGLVPGFQVGGFWSVLGGAIIISLVNFALQALLRKAPSS